MDDQQRQPRDGDRNPVRDRIKRAVAEGRIGSVDGEIRLTNVASAQSMSELGLIVRELDQLDAAVGPLPPAPSPGAPFPGAVPRPAASSGSRMVPVIIVVVVLVLIGAAGTAVFVVSGSTESATKSQAGPESASVPATSPLPRGPQTPVVRTTDPSSPVAPDADYDLSASGIQAFLATYRHRFGTTKVVGLTMYGDYVVLQVPVAGKDRHAGWLYRNGVFTDFGGVTANFPGSAVVDTRRLDVAALMRNVAKARRTLKVEDYDSTYVNIDYRPEFDHAPNVNIYVSNKFNESGYLATNLDGSVERAYPYGS